ncbi:hypothetical protein B0A48_02655 [Cryoendolithus antarcticus]|uniref:Cytochrome P450 n=1 Tax=Cryoendolithus antarcticus TaxID=1507870 RepID=A0A1V8TKX2_9PEZI|nr:hypothetical protein B0A48_02655 [Cryoendolithus antarcticus]
MLAEGYFKYNKQGLPFAAPNFNNFIPNVIVPPEFAHWMDSQPEDKLSAREGQLYFLSKYTFSHPRLHQDTLDANTARTAMIVRLQTLFAQVNDEIVTALNDVWGNDEEEWKEVNLYETMWVVVARAANRAFLGRPLCRDARFLDTLRTYVNSFATQGILIRFLVPEILQPVLGRMLAWPVHLRYRRLVDGYLLPYARHMIREMKSGKLLQDEDSFAHWLAAADNSKHPDDETMADALAGQLASAEFAPLHTSTFAITNTLLDILSSPQHGGILAALRNEAEAALQGAPDTWTRADILRLELADSVIRESQRLNRTTGKAMLRRVVAKEGLALPDGTHIPNGIYIGLSAEGIHMDPDLYEAPEEFRPFRFAGMDGREKARKLVSIGIEYLPFGYGRHGCPGRFFVASMLTVMLAVIARGYEIEGLEERPKGHSISDHSAPPRDVMVRVRRRRKVI